MPDRKRETTNARTTRHFCNPVHRRRAQVDERALNIMTDVTCFVAGFPQTYQKICAERLIARVSAERELTGKRRRESRA